MSAIANLSDKMKKKLSFGDYAINCSQAAVESVSKARKIYALTRNDTDKLHAIFSKRLHTATASSLSEILSEAIHILYQQETQANKK